MQTTKHIISRSLAVANHERIQYVEPMRECSMYINIFIYYSCDYANN